MIATIIRAADTATTGTMGEAQANPHLDVPVDPDADDRGCWR